MKNQEEFSLTIKGFKTKQQVDAFISWYEGQGEQDASIWFDTLKSEGDLDVDTMNTNMTKPFWPPTVDGKNVTIYIKPL